MARKGRIYYNGELTYPYTIPDAVIEPGTKKTLSTIIAELREDEVSEEDVGNVIKEWTMKDKAAIDGDQLIVEPDDNTEITI